MQDIIPEEPLDLAAINLFGELPRGRGGGGGLNIYLLLLDIFLKFILIYVIKETMLKFKVKK